MHPKSPCRLTRILRCAQNDSHRVPSSLTGYYPITAVSSTRSYRVRAGLVSALVIVCVLHGVGVAVGVPLTLVDFVRPLVVGTSSASIQVAKPVPASPLTVFTSCWMTPDGLVNPSGGK